MFTAHDTAPHGVTDSEPKEWILFKLYLHLHQIRLNIAF